MKKKWVVWSGRGDIGNQEIKHATEIGIKRILTAERCGGDRWAYAAEYTGDPFLDCCSVVKERLRSAEMRDISVEKRNKRINGGEK